MTSTDGASGQRTRPLQVPGAPHRPPSARSQLLAAGFTDTTRARACLEDANLSALLGQQEPGSDWTGGPTGRLVQDLGRTADPDMALLTLVRLVEASPPPVRETLARLLAARQGPLAEHLNRLLSVLGASRALGDFLVAHPQRIGALAPEHAPEACGQSAEQALLAAVEEALAEPPSTAMVGAGQAPAVPEARATAALRVAYRERLAAIAADDLAAQDPAEHVSVMAKRLTDLADAALEAGLRIARHAVGLRAQRVALAVIAMGKTGAGELNYVSDVDVIYVVGPGGAGEQATEEELLSTGTALATELARVICAADTEPALWPLDTALRPEGKDGALVRTLASHVTYYERWAASWEFQALLKARAAAGDRELGRAYEEAVAPFVWGASLRENFVDDARAMRRRVERESSGPGEDNRIKLGPGGLRDVEFTVQLLQLVHGRGDRALRPRSTLEALNALSAGGYVSRQDATTLDADYRLLRLLEHRSQLYRLHRTHDLPSQDADLRRIGRGLRAVSEQSVATSDHAVRRALASEGLSSPAALRALFHATKRRVRSVHEVIYYRPLLGAAAQLTADEMTLTSRAARERLAAVGYLDPDGALRHISALTEGVSRRAAIQRQILPVIIGWLGDGPDPDAGLLSFRRLSETIGGSHWYLASLRDSPTVAQRLCHVLAGARWTTDLLAERPEAIAWLHDDAELRPRPGAVRDEAAAALRRHLHAIAESGTHPHSEAADAVHALASIRSREMLRAALADSLEAMDPVRTALMLTEATDVLLDGALAVATALVIAERDGTTALEGGPGQDMQWQAARAHHAVVAMGRLGGQETTYSSDADVLFVHRARAGANEAEAAAEAEAVARRVTHLLAMALPHPLEVDADLRPEGRRGPMSRSLDSYRDYYQRWSSPWEAQALLRARPCGGDPELGAAFADLVASVRWPAGGLDQGALRQVRRLKARMESERMPRGVDSRQHLKLGPGGLSDVEWTVQVLQLQHGFEVPALRTTSTLEALRGARAEGLLTGWEADVLEHAWVLAASIRAANVVGAGRGSGGRADVLPTRGRDVRVVGRLLGLSPGRERALEDRYRRAARHARPVVERVVFDRGPAGAGAPGGSGDRGSAPGPSGGTGPAGSPAAPAGRPTPPRRASRPSGSLPAAPPRRPRRAGPYPWS